MEWGASVSANRNAPRRSSPTLVDSSSPSDSCSKSGFHLSVKRDGIGNRYPSTRVFMSEVRIPTSHIYFLDTNADNLCLGSSVNEHLRKYGTCLTSILTVL
jgi:hypothetical protein